MHTCTHTHTCTHIHARTHAHTHTHTVYFEYRSSATVWTLSAHGRRGLILSPPPLKVRLRLLAQRPAQVLVHRQEGVPRHNVCGGLIACGSVVKFLPTVRAKADVTFVASTWDGRSGATPVRLASCCHFNWHPHILMTLGTRVKERVIVCHLVCQRGNRGACSACVSVSGE